jgi:hypothetical protein
MRFTEIMLRLLGVAALFIAILWMIGVVCGLGVGYGVIWRSAQETGQRVMLIVATAAMAIMITMAAIAIYKMTRLIGRLLRKPLC